MSETNSSSEEKKKCEKEFYDFLAERIKNVGGSLQFQHLMGLLPQLSCETRKAVGSTRSELMRFLKAHNKEFEVDAKGIVSIIDSSVSDADSDTGNKNGNVSQINMLPSTIQEGMGVISRIHPEFGFINALEPLETSVYFTALDFGGDKDALLTDFDLQKGTEVCFNAVRGHSDCDAKYRATKVWRQPETEEDNSNVIKHSRNKDIKNSEGKIQKIFPDFGFISVDDNKNDTVFFNKNSFVDHDSNEDLTKILRQGDRVRFSAIKSQKKDSKAMWQATEVHKIVKKPREYAKPISAQSMKIEMLKSQEGKIYPHTNSNGATIKFGEKFSKSANGDSSVYFLYGAQVTDIPWEFSSGDDVSFDAVKVKSGWKALLVWVGERPDFVLPTCVGDFSEFLEEEYFEDKGDRKPSSSGVYSSELPSDLKPNVNHSDSKHLKKDRNFESQGHFECKDRNESGKKVRKYDTPPSRDSSLNSYSSRESSNYRKQKKGHKNEISSAKYVRNPDHLSQGKVEHNKYNNAAESSASKNQNQLADHAEQENYHNSKKDAIRKNEFKNKSTKQKFLFEAEVQTSMDLESKDNVWSEKKEKKLPQEASIKTFESLDCTVIRVLCKFAFVKNPELQKEILFATNVFYRNGCSVEEQHAEDLKEIIFVDDSIKINCFEIVDDSGDLHNSVTLAWIGKKPREVNEVTPDDYIKQMGLSVTVSNKSGKGDGKVETDTPKKFLSAVIDSDSDVYLSDCQGESVSFHSSFDEISPSYKDFTYEVHKNKGSSRETDSISAHNRPLHLMISDKLRSEGVLLSDSEVKLEAVSVEIIDLVLRHHETEVNDNHQLKVTDFVCGSCLQKNNGTFSNSDVKYQSKGVQTIITGEIVAQRFRKSIRH